MKYNIAVTSHMGLSRSINQDNYYCEGRFREIDNNISSFQLLKETEKPWIMAVFDGMGGEKYGEVASLIAAEITNEYCRKTIVDAENLIFRINSDICKEMETRRSRMGSTCVFYEVDNDRIRSWNVGDSRAYLYHGGKLLQLSEDHTEAASYSSLFTDDSAIKAGSENKLTQNLGTPEDDFIIEPFVTPWMNIESGDILILCTDGLTHMVSDESIKEVLSSNSSTSYKTGKLLNLALDNGGMDNITIILAEVIS